METTTVSIQETYLAMSEIGYGTQAASPKLAFWSASLSCRMKLHLNGGYTRIMAQFVNKPLPDRETLLDIMGRKAGQKFPQGIMTSHINALYEIERLDTLGLLNFDAGNTIEAQQAWRDTMVARIKGLGSKLVSWALFIYNPMDCLLLTIDCHHCSRMGIEQSLLGGSSKSQKKNYNKFEACMLAECMGLFPEYPPVVTAAMLWQNHRLAKGASNEAGYESHKAISCRWY